MYIVNPLHSTNKNDSDAIVFPDAFGRGVRITATDFSSQDEFEKWKLLLDADAHQEQNEDHIFYNHTVSLSTISEDKFPIPSVEETMILDCIESGNRHRKEKLLIMVKECLTNTQYQRLLLYYGNGLTETEIAQQYGVTQQSVSENILAAIKKLEKFSNYKKNTL